MFEGLAHWWRFAIDSLSAHVVERLLAFLHLGTMLGEPDDVAEALLIALLQIGIIMCVFRPLETFAPAEPWEHRQLTKVDRRFTFLLLGVNPLIAFFVLSPFASVVGRAMGVAGLPSDGILHFIPRIDEHPYIAFGIYYVANDLAYYWMHRAQHAIPWWWALHSMHHSQRQVNCWTNARVSYLDAALESCLLATVGLVMGVDVSQFAWLLLSTELVQNFSHANTRFGFGRFLERLIVGPRFHRLHHMAVDASRPRVHNCNYGQVLSVWDNFFGTALYHEPVHPTGVSDPAIDCDNRHGAIAMQWRALRRFWGAITSRAGWTPQDVTFDANFGPIAVSQPVDAN